MALTQVTSIGLKDGEIVNADLHSAASVALSKLADTGALGSAITATTQSASDDSTKLATTAFVQAAVTSLIDGAPGSLNTLNELAAAINDDSSYATTLTTALATKLPLAGGNLTGNLGIGVSSPSRSLHISNNGTDGTQLQLTGTLDSAGIKCVPSSGDTFEYQAAATGCHVAYNRTDSRADIFVDGTGNVGLGTTSPDQILECSQSTGTTLIKAAVGGNSRVGFEIEKTGATTQTWRIQDGQSGNGLLEIYDQTDSRSVMVFDGSGNVGIGTTSSDQLLHLAAASNGPFIRLENTDTSISANQTFGGIEFESKDGSTGSAGVISKIDCISTAAFDGSSVVGGALRFHTSTTNSISLQERFRINADGSVGINTDVNGNGGLVQIRNNHAYQSGTTDLLTSASKAALRIRTSSDSSKSLYIGGIDNTAEPYLQVGNLHTASGGATASYDLHLQPYGGDVSLYNDGDLKAWTYVSGLQVKSTTRIQGVAGGNATLLMYADDAGQAADYWKLSSEHVGNGFTIASYASGSWQSVLRATDARTIELHYQDNVRLATTSGGVSVTGTLSCSSNFTASGGSNVMGTTTFVGGGGAGGKIMIGQYSSSDKFRVSNTGTVSAVATTISSISSERRTKENIVNIEADKAWSTLKGIKLYSYFFKNDETSTTHYGPIVDEVPSEMVVPTGDSDEVGVINTYNSEMLLFRAYSALQQAITKIETLETKVAALEGG